MTKRVRSLLLSTLWVVLGFALVLACGFAFLRVRAGSTGMGAMAGGLSQGAVSGLLAAGAVVFWAVFRLLSRRGQG